MSETISNKMQKELKAQLLVSGITKTSESTWISQSQSSDKIYHINGDQCECPDCDKAGNYCKHLMARDLYELEASK